MEPWNHIHTHCNVLRKYRPVSNLSCIFKVLERVICNLLINHIYDNDLIDKFLSAYKEGHSMETALMKFVMTCYVLLTKETFL